MERRQYVVQSVYRVFTIFVNGSVDGRNPANQLIWRISRHLQGFMHPNGGCLGFLPSTVVTLP